MRPGVLLIHDKTQVEITADPDRLLQVVTNLLVECDQVFACQIQPSL